MFGKKLLVADDSLTIQKVIRLALANEGYEIQAVSDGNDAIQQISLVRPDVILIDIALPGKSAFEVKREINLHEDLADLKVILMWSAFEKIDEDLASEVQFDGRLMKPFDPESLRQVLQGVISSPGESPEESNEEQSPPPLPPGEFEDLPIPKGFSFEPPELPPESELPELPQLPDLPELEMDQEPGLPPDNPTPMPPPYEEDSSIPDTGPPPPPLELDLAPGPPKEFIEIPPFPGPPPEDLQPLWEAQPPSLEGSEESDIRSLTESTMRLSTSQPLPPETLPGTLPEAFGDQWSVNEPSLKPPPFPLDQGDIGGKLQPPPPPVQSPPPWGQAPPGRPKQSRNSPPPPPFLPGASLETTLGSDSLSPAEIESLVRREVEAALSQMAQKLLPDLAEKVIKQEIHKMLSDP